MTKNMSFKPIAKPVHPPTQLSLTIARHLNNCYAKIL